MEKLISRIPPPPRLPRVDGVNPIAPGVELVGGDEPRVTTTDRASVPRWRVRKLARAQSILQASGAVIAALLLGAAILWATR